MKKLNILRTVFRNARVARKMCLVYLSASFEMLRELLYLCLVIYSMVMYTGTFAVCKLDNAGALAGPDLSCSDISGLVHSKAQADVELYVPH